MSIAIVLVCIAFAAATALSINLIVSQGKEIKELKEDYDQAMQDSFEAYYTGVREGITIFAKRLKIRCINPQENYENWVVKVTDIDELSVVVKEEDNER